MIRPFDWRDFPRLHRYRNQGLWLDNELALTRWLFVVPAGALLAYIAPATGIFTYVASENGKKDIPVVGQFLHQAGAGYAKLAFIAPEGALSSSMVLALMDHLATQSGNRGALGITAEVDERSNIFEILRKSGYAIFARQRLWKLEKKISIEGHPTPWRPVSFQDQKAIRNLYGDIVPALVQQTETPPWENLNGFVYWEGEELMAYIHLITGPRGILANPLIHPDIGRVTGRVAALLNGLGSLGGRPVYITARSYQGWLETPLEELGASAGTRQAVMVKRLVLQSKVKMPLKIPATGLDNAHPEASATTVSSNGDLAGAHFDMSGSEGSQS